eukprot:2572004-Rhodomonas_salina.1
MVYAFINCGEIWPARLGLARQGSEARYPQRVPGTHRGSQVPTEGPRYLPCTSARSIFPLIP